MKKYLIIFILFILLIQLFSNEKNILLSDVFSKTDLINLENGNFLTRMYVKFNIRGENTDSIINIPKTIYSKEDYSVYEVITDEKVFIPYNLTEETKLNFYNILTSYSKLEGMVYYSRSDAKVTKLIMKCYRVESLSGNKYNDIKYSKILPKITNMFLQKDNKLGTLIFRSELYNEGNNFIMVNVCIQPISKLFIDINKKEEYKIVSFFIYDEIKKGFYMYTFQVMRVRIENLLKNGNMFKPTTFSNRLRASTIHLAKLIGLDWKDKLNPWKGKYDSY